MALPWFTCQAKEVISRLKLLIVNQKVWKKNIILCQKEQEQGANKLRGYTIKAVLYQVTRPFHLLSAVFLPVNMFSPKAWIFMMSSGYCIAVITHHSARRGPSQRRAAPLTANGEARETDLLLGWWTIGSKLFPYTSLSRPHNPAFLSLSLEWARLPGHWENWILSEKFSVLTFPNSCRTQEGRRQRGR